LLLSRLETRTVSETQLAVYLDKFLDLSEFKINAFGLCSL
jgi:hypothetical protein